jgi:hypothetical protein
MKKITKKVAKGLPVSIRVRKPRYYYQDIDGVYTEDVTHSLEFTKFEGIDYVVNDSFVEFEGKELWNREKSPKYSGLLAPYDNGQPYVAVKKGFTYTEEGSLVNDNLVYSGFSSSSYIKLPLFGFGTASWEFTLKVTPSEADLTAESSIISAPVDSRGIRIGTAGTTKGRWEFLASTGNGWINASSHYGSHVVQAGVTYWLKAGFDVSSGKYYLKYSTNGEDYIDDVSYTNASVRVPVFDHYMGIAPTGFIWNGSIDLNDCNLVVNGSEVWGKDATAVVEAEGCLDGMVYVPTSDMTLTAVSRATNVLLLPRDGEKDTYTWAGEVFVPQHLVREMYRKNYSGGISFNPFFYTNGFKDTLTPVIFKDANNFTLISKVRISSSNPQIILCSNDTSGTTRFYIDSSRKLSLYSGSTYTGKTALTLDTWYWIKLEWDGTNLKWYTAPYVGNNYFDLPWNEEGSVAKNPFTEGVYKFGYQGNNTSQFLGEIDLTQTTLMVNDSLEWKPLSEV